MDDIRPLVYFRPDFGGWCQVTLALITLGAGAREPTSGNVSRRQMSEPESVCHMPETRDLATRVVNKLCVLFGYK